MPNISASLVQLIHDIAFVRLYTTSKDGTTLVMVKNHTVYGRRGAIYRPSDRMESFLYEFRAHVVENNLRETKALNHKKQTYLMYSIGEVIFDLLWRDVKATRFAKAGRESLATMVCKVVSDMGLVDGDLSLTQCEVGELRKRGLSWAGCIEIDTSDWEIR